MCCVGFSWLSAAVYSYVSAINMPNGTFINSALKSKHYFHRFPGISFLSQAHYPRIPVRATTSNSRECSRKWWMECQLLCCQTRLGI
ncbi:hypothetical protein BDZ97DRAFT_1871481 [Flammula alnicola]|nr:hypothetical protein BDZ97DRAFT_1871481 [Flammula alnicola]